MITDVKFPHTPGQHRLTKVRSQRSKNNKTDPQYEADSFLEKPELPILIETVRLTIWFSLSRTGANDRF